MPTNSKSIEAKTQAALVIARRFMASASAADRARLLSALAEGARGRALVASSSFDAVLRDVSRQVAAAHLSGGAAGATYASASAVEMDRAMGTAPARPAVEHRGSVSTFRAPTGRGIL